MLLHNGNKFPSLPLAYATNMKEKFENLKILLEKIQYFKYCWIICCDLKLIALLIGLQLGYTKFRCFFVRMGQQGQEKSLHQEGMAKA